MRDSASDFITFAVVDTEIQQNQDTQAQLDDLRDQHAIQLAECKKREAEGERNLQASQREVLDLRRQQAASAAEIDTLKSRNEELLDHIHELEGDLQSSDKDLEQAINCLEQHGIKIE